MTWFKTSAIGAIGAIGLGASAIACSDPTSFNPRPHAGMQDAAVGVAAADAMMATTATAADAGDATTQKSVAEAGPSPPIGPSTVVPCVDPTQPNCTIAVSNINKVCPASQEWVPITPPLPASLLFKPLQHPSPECPFYRFGFQNFLLATQPDPTSGEAAIVTYPTIDDAFTKTTPLPTGALAPAGMHRGTAMRAWLGDIKQAGQRQIVVDQSGHSLYYGIHLNQAFVDFINSQQTKLANGQSVPLSTLAGVRNADPNLFLPSGLVEFKSAWKDIDVRDGVSAADNASFMANYVTTMAWIPPLSQDAQGNFLENKDKPIQRQMALVALHVVYTIPGHPEFVWASFQHIDQNGNADTAGVASAHPPMSDPYNAMNSENVCPADAGVSFLLCRPGTLAKEGNAPYKDQDFKLGGADGQTFLLKTTGAVAQTSIYRMFPGSKSNSDVPDDDVVSLNANMDAVWAQAGVQGTIDPNDRKRRSGGVARGREGRREGRGGSSGACRSARGRGLGAPPVARPLRHRGRGLRRSRRGRIADLLGQQGQRSREGAVQPSLSAVCGRSHSGDLHRGRCRVRCRRGGAGGGDLALRELAVR
ncbi:MAG: hypothetical protein M3O36_15810 [Myxococcota bacterium]|nr:hypothetical protein [Myxococcota bacterium]